MFGENGSRRGQLSGNARQLGGGTMGVEDFDAGVIVDDEKPVVRLNVVKSFTSSREVIGGKN